MTRTFATLALTFALLASPAAFAGEKKLMHCFAFTPVKDASQADWDAFYKATDLIPKKINGVSKVWYGKLASTLGRGDSAREYGVCMEMTDQAARTAYGNAPYHAEWLKAYEKVRVDGTTTFDILGQ
jgi:hypothetical protein